MSIDFYSTFAGIGGFDLGFERAGMRCIGQSELIAGRREVLARQWPDVPQQGDIRAVTGTSIGNPDLLTAGFPCKQLSVAAPHRQGLDGKDSKLLYEFYRLVGEYLRLVDHARPRWLVLENTPGLLRSRKGRDMAAVVMGLEELGYGWAYRVVDGGGLGTPQRRRRVVIVGHRGGDPRPALAVLGDPGSGAEVAAPGVGGQPGPRPHAGAVAAGGSIVRFWRKSANSQVSIDKGYEGGYRETWRNDGFVNTLTSTDTGNSTRQKHLIAQPGGPSPLRTLTVTEWERLSGFPDGWTDCMSQSERFASLGDTFHVGTSEWLGRRLLAVHEGLDAHPTLFADLPDHTPAAIGDQLALFA